MSGEEKFNIQSSGGFSVADLSIREIWTAVVSLSGRVSEIEKTASPLTNTKNFDRDLTLSELAHELNKSYTTVWRMVRKRRLIPVDNSSRTLRFRRKDVEVFKKSVTW
jgi:hypothetical protein